MPRRKVVSNVGFHRGYEIKEKYSYDGKQLNAVIDALEFYHKESERDKGSNYVVFDIIIEIKYRM